MIRRGTRLFGAARYFWQALREISPGEVRAELEQPFLIGVFGRAGSGRRSLARALFGIEPDEWIGSALAIAGVGTAAVAAAGKLDLAFLLLDATQPDWTEERRTAHEIAQRGCPLFLVVTHADQLPVVSQVRRAVGTQFPDHPPELIAVVDPRQRLPTRLGLVGPLLRTVPHLRLALAHHFPSLRRVVAEDLVRETSRLNAQFALFSSLPAMVPLVGSLVSGVADTLVLTKNQALLVFKLAGIHGRDLDDRLGIVREIVPVIGAAFLWRSAARTIVGLLPAIVSAVPKTAVAYVGTYVVGETARYYYERGERPPPELLRHIQAEALRRYREVNERLLRRLEGPPAPQTTDRAKSFGGTSADRV